MTRLHEEPNHRLSKLYKQTMRLELVNFRCFDRATFELKANYCLISGPSGSGKTTIFMAIQFAITGKGEKVTRIGSSACRVTLVTDSLTIKRSKGPKRLIVECNDGRHEDAEAQAVIDAHMPNWHFGYVSQRIYKSFVAISPAERLEIIEKMAFGMANVSRLHDNCKALISKRKTILTNVSGQILSLKNVLQEMHVTRRRDVDESNLSKRLDIAIQSDANKMERGRICRQLDALVIPHVPNDVNVESLCAQKRAYDDYKLASERLDLMTRHDDVDDLDVMIDELSEMVAIETKLVNLDETRREKRQLEKYLSTHGIRMTCPSCNVEFGKRHTISAVEEEECNRRLARLSTRLLDMDQLVARHDEIKARYDDTLNAHQQLTELVKIKSDNDKYDQLAKSIVQCDPPIVNVNDVIMAIEATRRKNELERQLSQLTIVVDETAQDVRDDMAHVAWNKQFDKLDELTAQELQAEKQLPTAIKLQSLIKTAERLALQETIKEINARVEMYSEAFSTRFVPLEMDIVGRVLMDGDVSILSGGEYARVVLAYAAALSDLNSVPVMMLDESISSLDAETADTVLTALRQNFSGKIYVIAHQTTHGSFDQVLYMS